MTRARRATWVRRTRSRWVQRGAAGGGGAVGRRAGAAAGAAEDAGEGGGSEQGGEGDGAAGGGSVRRTGAGGAVWPWPRRRQVAGRGHTDPPVISAAWLQEAVRGCAGVRGGCVGRFRNGVRAGCAAKGQRGLIALW